jgi:hypothetical protein
MKTFIFCILLLSTNLIKAQGDASILKEDASILSVFITDFVSNDFEGGFIYHLLKNNTDSLLFQIDYSEPSDFGSIEFKHIPSNIIVFKGTIVWDGAGEMKIPERLLQPPVFSTGKKRVNRPVQYQHFVYRNELQNFIFDSKNQAAELLLFGAKKMHTKELENCNSLEIILDRAWKSIENLEIVNDLVQQNSKVGFYFYTPSVGMFDATHAKWITFLYMN